MNTPDGAFQYMVFFLQPGKKAGDIAANVVHSGFAAVVDLLVVRQIGADLIGCDLPHRCTDRAKHVGDAAVIIGDRAL